MAGVNGPLQPGSFGSPDTELLSQSAPGRNRLDSSSTGFPLKVIGLALTTALAACAPNPVTSSVPEERSSAVILSTLKNNQGAWATDRKSFTITYLDPAHTLNGPLTFRLVPMGQPELAIQTSNATSGNSVEGSFPAPIDVGYLVEASDVFDQRVPIVKPPGKEGDLVGSDRACVAAEIKNCMEFQP